MNTLYCKPRLAFYCILCIMLFTSCTTPAQSTRDSVQAKMRQAVNNADEAALLAGAYMVYSDAKQIAIFVTPGAGQYTLIGAVDTAHTALLDANRLLVDFGIDIAKVKTLEELKAILRARGFSELSPGLLPMLHYALKLGLGYMRSVGGTAIDLMVVPAFMMQPAWCIDGSVSCGGKQQ